MKSCPICEETGCDCLKRLIQESPELARSLLVETMDFGIQKTQLSGMSYKDMNSFFKELSVLFGLKYFNEGDGHASLQERITKEVDAWWGGTTTKVKERKVIYISFPNVWTNSSKMSVYAPEYWETGLEIKKIIDNRLGACIPIERKFETVGWL